MITIKLKSNHGLNSYELLWLSKNVGRRLHYLPGSVGGEGWIAKRNWSPGMVTREWNLTFEDDKYATWFTIMFPQ